MIVYNFLQLILFKIIVQTRGMEVHPSVKDNNILVTATAIRNTTNELFLAFRLKEIKANPKLRQSSLIHNFFSTITLKDHDTLNQIAILSRAKTTNITNETRGFMDAINELLNKDPGNDIEITNKDNLEDHVSKFLTNLEYLKDSNGVNDNYFDVNNQILNISRFEHIYNLTKDRDSDRNDSLLSDNEFWVPEQSGRRIYQGDKTKIKYFPFMASIQIFNSFQCGGCIVKSDLIITAASCLQLAWNNRFFRENPSFLSVRIGSLFYNGGGESIPVLEVYFHPEYNPKTLKNNICLLRLIRNIKFRRKSKNVRKIDFDREPSKLPLTTDGITIVGWGAKGVANVIRDPFFNRLSFSVLDIYPLQECQEIYSSQYVTKKNFCAGFFSKGGGACNGDVGGPGIVDGILTGIVSFGSPRCGTPDAPTVFTKLGYYTDWIETIMEQDVPHTYKRTTLRTTPIPITLPRPNPKATTFILEPIVGKWKPIGINEDPDNALRVLNDENLFKEFLNTMFGSEEAKEYEELFANEGTENNKNDINIQRNEPERQKMPESKRQNAVPLTLVTHNIEETTQPYIMRTVSDKSLILDDKERMSDDDDSESDDIESNLLELIENIDVDSNKEIENKETDVSESETEELVLEVEKQTTIVDKMKKIDDTILTLLYLSDSEKNAKNFKDIGNVIEDFDEHVNDGLSIGMDSYKDLMFRANGSKPSYQFLPKDEMYELLAGAIDDVAKNKK